MDTGREGKGAVLILPPRSRSPVQIGEGDPIKDRVRGGKSLIWSLSRFDSRGHKKTSVRQSVCAHLVRVEES